MRTAAEVSLLIYALAAVASPCRAAEPAQAAQDNCFRIFDATGLKARPELRSYGIEPAPVIYAIQHFWPERSKQSQLPRRDRVEWTVKRLAGVQPPRIMIFDLEHWPNVGDEAAVAASVEKYVTLIDWAKASGSGVRFGFYGVPPLRDYWRAIQDPASDAFRQWQAENDRFKPLAAAVDVFAPSLYTFYDDVEGWKRYAAANIREARRLAGGKPVYAFIWPQYHDSNVTLRGKYLPPSVWLEELLTLEDLADGAIIWTGPGWWDENASWWQATRRFIATSNKVCRS